MGENSQIEWCDHTFNPWIGCTKLSGACDNCYAEKERAVTCLGVTWGAGEARHRTAVSTWKKPLAWDRKADKEGRRARVFCASLADVFDSEVNDDWRDDLFALIAGTPHLNWLLLTKRPKVARDYLKARYSAPTPWWEAGARLMETHRAPSDVLAGALGAFRGRVPMYPLPNVWLGVTVEDQKMADLRIPLLLETPAAVRFLSMEPLLGPVRLDQISAPHGMAEGQPWLNALGGFAWDNDGDTCPVGARIDWVITGGESGPNARPSHPDWFRSIRDQCAAAGVPFLFKQWGEWREPLDGEEFDTSLGRAGKPPSFIMSSDGTVHCFQGDHTTNGKAMICVGKKAAGRELDGVIWDQIPVWEVPW